MRSPMKSDCFVLIWIPSMCLCLFFFFFFFLFPRRENYTTRDGENRTKKRFEKSRGIPDKIHMKSGDTEREQQTSTHAKGKRIANRRN